MQVSNQLQHLKRRKFATNLYKLLGDTIQEADASIVAGSQEETTMIWHCRQGHMYERGLKVLAEL